MWLEDAERLRKQDLMLRLPMVNTAGTLGFAPNPRKMPFLDNLGAFITNPISRRRRAPAGNRCSLPFEGGFLLHTGLQNPGISRAITLHKARWAGAPLPVIVHLLVETPDTLAEMVRKLEGLENILAIELGLPPLCDPDTLSAFVEAAYGELPAIVCLGLEQTPALLDTLERLAPSAVHITPPRGALPEDDDRIISGRLFGPAIYPIMLHTISAVVKTGLPVISSGGVMTRQEVDALLHLGVMAVGLGSVLWHVDQGCLFVK